MPWWRGFAGAMRGVKQDDFARLPRPDEEVWSVGWRLEGQRQCVLRQLQSSPLLQRHFWSFLKFSPFVKTPTGSFELAVLLRAFDFAVLFSRSMPSRSSCSSIPRTFAHKLKTFDRLRWRGKNFLTSEQIQNRPSSQHIGGMKLSVREGIARLDTNDNGNENSQSLFEFSRSQWTTSHLV